MCSSDLAKRKGKWLPLPLEEVRAEAVWAGHLKISLTSVNTISRISYSIKVGVGKYLRSNVMHLRPGSNVSLSQQMLLNMKAAVEKPGLSKQAIDNFGAALKWMLKNICTYKELVQLQLPRSLMQLKKMPLIPEDLNGVVKTVEIAWRSIAKNHLQTIASAL